MSRIPAFFVCSKQVQRSKQIRRQHLHFGLRHFLAKPAKELLTEELEANVMQMRRNQHQSNKKQLLTSCTNEKARHPYFSCLQLNTLAMLERRGGPRTFIGGGAAQDGEILLAWGPDPAPPAGGDIRLVLPQLLVVRGRLY